MLGKGEYFLTSCVNNFSGKWGSREIIRISHFLRGNADDFTESIFEILTSQTGINRDSQNVRTGYHKWHLGNQAFDF